MITASAPGKVVIVGEYAVLENAPGIVCALPRRASVSVARGSHSGWRVRTPPLSPDCTTLRRRAGGQLVGTDGAGIALLDAALEQFFDAASRPPPADGIDLHLDTRAFHSAGAKLGIGSSAALCTALVGALATMCRRPLQFSAALAAHRSFQAGSGSGIDVAASWSGGTIAFRPDRQTAIQKLDWPPDLHALVVWTGQSASTTGRLGRLRRYAAEQPDRYGRLMRPLTQLAVAAPSAWPGAADFIALTEQFSHALRALSDACGLEVWTDAHLRIATYAERFGLLYKTSGAGGGDCGLALATDAGRIRDFAADLDRRGIESWPLECDPQGLIVTGRSEGG